MTIVTRVFQGIAKNIIKICMLFERDYPCRVSEYRFGNKVSLFRSASEAILFPCK